MDAIYRAWIDPSLTPWEPGDFLAIPWREADRFLQWLVAQIPERIRALEAFVSSTPRYESWRADSSEHSVAQLAPWFVATIERRPPTPEELANWPKPKILNPDLPPEIVADIMSWPPDVPWVYADLALARSVLLDIGLYMAECLRAIDPEMSWQRTKGDKRDMEYNYPVLTGRATSFNPFWVPRNILGRVCDGQDPAQLVQAYRSYLSYVKQGLARRG